MPKPEVYQTKNEGKRYRVRFRQYDDRKGKLLHRSKTFGTPPEAQHFCNLIRDYGVERAVAEIDNERDQSDELTLDEWAAVHFAALTEAAEDTIDRYKGIYAHAWSPHLGHMRLSQIGRTDVAAAVNALTGSDKTRKNKWAVLTHMLKMAAQDGLIPRSPTVGVKLGRRTEHEIKEHRYLTHAEFWAVLDASPDHWRPLVMMAGGTGMRWGELAALTVGDVDPDSMVVRVTKAEKQRGKVVGPTKSKKSNRTVTLPTEVLEAVLPLMEGRKRTDRLFVPPKGGPLRQRTFYRDIWLRKCVGNSGIREPFPRFHDLRHSHCAWLIAAGASLPVIQARLGHEKITTTIDTYGHLLPDVQRAAADAAGLVFAGRPLAIAPSSPDGP